MPESCFDFLQNGHEPLNCLGVVVGEEEAFAAIQGFNSSHIFRCQCEIEKVKILFHDRLYFRLGERLPQSGMRSDYGCGGECYLLSCHEEKM